jgi:hypothetical protein
MNEQEIKDADLLKSDLIECFGGESGDRVIRHLKKQFEVGMPIFCKAEARTKHDDPLYDALIRDGNHEVVRYIEDVTKLSYTREG